MGTPMRFCKYTGSDPPSDGASAIGLHGGTYLDKNRDYRGGGDNG